MEVFDITNPRYNEHISPVPWHFVKSKSPCTTVKFVEMDQNLLKSAIRTCFPLSQAFRRPKGTVRWRKILAPEFLFVSLERWPLNMMDLELAAFAAGS